MGFDQRNSIILGDDGISRLKEASVAVYGLGGVGAACAMDLVRAGIGSIFVQDFDSIAESNLNRLYFGYRKHIGQPKTQVFKTMALEINPSVQIRVAEEILSTAGAGEAIAPNVHIHIDCIDSLNPKIMLIASLIRNKKTFISSMGTSGRIQPELLKLGSVWESRGCPLAKRIRQGLRRLGLGPDDSPVPCVWSDEPPTAPAPPLDNSIPGEIKDGIRVRAVQGSLPFVPQAAGHILASWAMRRILELRDDRLKVPER